MGSKRLWVFHPFGSDRPALAGQPSGVLSCGISIMKVLLPFEAFEEFRTLDSLLIAATAVALVLAAGRAARLTLLRKLPADSVFRLDI